MEVTRVSRIQSPSEVALALIRQEHPDYHPLIALAKMAHRADVIEDPKLEFEVHKAILPYVSQKLPSAEGRAPRDDDERRVIVSLFEQTTLEDGRVVDVEIPLITEVSELVPLDS